MFSIETFSESKKEQFKNDALMILRECQYGHQNLLDITSFNNKLEELHKFARLDGLSKEQWDEIINYIQPDNINTLRIASVGDAA